MDARVQARARHNKDMSRSHAMQKWNMIIDVAECTNCNLCTLAVMDEYVGNEWPGYTAPMPKHGHKWINILQKERGQVPMIDIAYVPTMCNHCDNAPCMAKGAGAVKKREDGIVLIDPQAANVRKAATTDREQIPVVTPQGGLKVASTSGNSACPAIAESSASACRRFISLL